MKTSWKRIGKDIIKYHILGRKPDEHNSLLFLSLGPGSLAIDCGAHVGEITGKILERGAQVIGFEPNPHAYSVYTEKFDDNPNFTSYQKAVWIEPGSMKLCVNVSKKRKYATSVWIGFKN